VVPQSGVVNGGKGLSLYFNCPEDRGELDLGAVCLVKVNLTAYDTGGASAWGASYPLPAGFSTSPLNITADKAGCAWRFQTRGTGCYRMMDLNMYDSAEASLNWFLKFDGCGSEGLPPPPPSGINPTGEAPAGQLVTNPTASYTTVNTTVTNVSAVCNVSIGTKVNASCCSGNATGGNFSQYTCKTLGYPLQSNPNIISDELYLRNYLGCESGIPVYAEACMPYGTQFDFNVPPANTTTYPFSSAGAAAYNSNGNSSQCNCASSPAVKAMYNLGPGCYRAQSFGDIWYYVTFNGTCS